MTALTPTLVQRAADGDPSACRTVIDALTPVIQARVTRALQRRAVESRGRLLRQEVLDLTQEVFMALFDHDARILRRWDPARGASLKTFAGLVAEREVRAVLRSRRRSPWTEDPTQPDDFAMSAPTPSAERRVAGKQTLRDVLDRLRGRLSDRGLLLFQALVVEQRPVDEVAAAHDMTRDAIYAWRTRLKRTVVAIAAELEEA